MKSYTFLFFFVFLMHITNAQDSQNITVNTDQEAQYPAGPEELIKFIYQQMRFTDEACVKELNTEAVMTFDVMPDSSLQNIQFIEKVGYGVDEELLRIFKALKFQPAIMMGMKIRRNVFQTVPIRTTKMMLDDKSRKEASAKPAAPAPVQAPANNVQSHDDE